MVMTNKGNATKENIRQETKKLFMEKGFQAVTMSDVCERTRLSRGGLYRYYGGTDEIFADILSSMQFDEGRIDEGADATEILEETLQNLCGEILEGEDSLSLAVYEYANVDQDFFVRAKQTEEARLKKLIEYGVQSGTFKSVDAEKTAELIMGYFQGLWLWARAIPVTAESVENFAASVRKLLLPDDETEIVTKTVIIKEPAAEEALSPGESEGTAETQEAEQEAAETEVPASGTGETDAGEVTEEAEDVPQMTEDSIAEETVAAADEEPEEEDDDSVVVIEEPEEELIHDEAAEDSDGESGEEENEEDTDDDEDETEAQEIVLSNKDFDVTIKIKKSKKKKKDKKKEKKKKKKDKKKKDKGQAISE